jgi:hypothetical protein
MRKQRSALVDYLLRNAAGVREIIEIVNEVALRSAPPQSSPALGGGYSHMF